MSKIKLVNVRLSFPSLFQHAQFGGESTGKYEATFVLDKVEHADLITSIKAKIAELMKTELKGKVAADKICLKDGDDLGRTEFEGKYTIKASTKKRPLVIDKDKSPLAQEDERVYAGCYVNAVVSLWAQNNNYGKRINAQLDGVQFFKDGEPFGDGGITTDEFDVVGGDDEEDFEF
jgi:hypothetical protein